MALKSVYPCLRTGYPYLNPSAFQRRNFGNPTMTSSRITVDTPDGVLAGMWGKFIGNYIVDVTDRTSVTAGLFLLSSSGNPFENTPAVASGKLSFGIDTGQFETDIYETRNEANTLDLNYTHNQYIYVSRNGLITNDNTPPVPPSPCGLITKIPSLTDPWLGFIKF